MKSTKKVSGAAGAEGVQQVDELLAAVPEPARTTLNKMRAMIRAIVPAEATEGISYGLAAFRYQGPLVGYGASTNHCALYPMNPAVIEEFAADLAKYETSKGAIRFALDKPLPGPLLKRLIKARIAQNEARKKSK